MANAMTMREFLNGVMAVEGMPAEYVEFAQAQVEKLNAKNAAKKVSESAKAKAAAQVEVQNAMLAVMEGGKFYTASELGQAVEVSTAKASAMARKLVEAGSLVEGEAKSNGRKVKAYALAASASEGEVEG